jgi:phosphatidylinositol kinase/protein kinase (PI-3  family)
MQKLFNTIKEKFELLLVYLVMRMMFAKTYILSLMYDVTCLMLLRWSSFLYDQDLEDVYLLTVGRYKESAVHKRIQKGMILDPEEEE